MTGATALGQSFGDRALNYLSLPGAFLEAYLSLTTSLGPALPDEEMDEVMRLALVGLTSEDPELRAAGIRATERIIAEPGRRIEQMNGADLDDVMVALENIKVRSVNHAKQDNHVYGPK
ncbi:unnamed protein product [Protopolystoma xenopodis]|uniref:Uncharacterized protein n=1 Tax=Protopolystoma xenopodis TaxID=117903 RepID=A0A3S5B2W3_9PLAT|nr:unnamed protein product [Protopolystoma xenopodis]